MRKTSAFTLIELLVVMVVIAMLMGILLPVLKGARLNAKITATRAEITALEHAIEDYTADFGAPPPDIWNEQLEWIITDELRGGNGENAVSLPKSFADINHDGDDDDIFDMQPGDAGFPYDATNGNGAECLYLFLTKFFLKTAAADSSGDTESREVRANVNGGPYYEINLKRIGVGLNDHPVFLDQFGNAFRYRNFFQRGYKALTDTTPEFPEEVNGRIVIYSCGPDGIDDFGHGEEDDGDDITNYR